MMKRDLLFGLATTIGAFLYYLSLGHSYTLSNMNPYLQSYITMEPSEVFWFNSVSSIFECLSTPIGGFIHTRFGFRVSLILGSIFSFVGLFAASYAIDSGLVLFIFCYCALYGLGIGLPYSVLLSVASSWFPKHRNVVAGIVMAGYGLGGVVFTPIQNVLINPNNLQDFTDPEVADSIAPSIRVCAGIILGMQVVALILSRENALKSEVFDPEDQTSVHEEFEPDTVYVEDENPVERSYTVAQAFKSPDFYILAAIIFAINVPTILHLSIYKGFGLAYLNDDTFVSTVVATTAVFNCTGRILWGLICDFFSFKGPLNTLLSIWAVLFGTLPFTSYSAVFKALYPIWLYAIALLTAGFLVLMPNATTRIFGPKYMSSIYGLIYCVNAPAALIISSITSRFDTYGHWIAVYMACAATCLFAFFLSLFLKDKQTKCGFPGRLCAPLCRSCHKAPTWTDDEAKESEESRKDQVSGEIASSIGAQTV